MYTDKHDIRNIIKQLNDVCDERPSFNDAKDQIKIPKEQSQHNNIHIKDKYNHDDSNKIKLS